MITADGRSRRTGNQTAGNAARTVTTRIGRQIDAHVDQAAVREDRNDRFDISPFESGDVEE